MDDEDDEPGRGINLFRWLKYALILGVLAFFVALLPFFWQFGMMLWWACCMGDYRG